VSIEIMPGEICGRCRQHPAAISYTEDVMMGWAHASMEHLCSCCALAAQIAYIEKMAAQLPGLRDEQAGACQP
jgi:hypothetical protein